MDLRVVGGMIQNVEADAIIVNLFEGQEPGGATGAVDKVLSGAIGELVRRGDVKGKLNETAVLYPRGVVPAGRVVVVGLGKVGEFTLDRARQAVSTGAKKARDLGARSIATIAFGAGVGGLGSQTSAQATAEGLLLGLYEFRAHKSTPADHVAVESATLVEADRNKLADVEAGVRLGRILAQATNLTRDLVNQPPNHMTPRILAEAARSMAAQSGLKFEVLDREQMTALGMGSLLGVTQGSDEPPQFIILEHKSDAGRPVIFAGKGITFDTGGISIKPAENMGTMKADMAGAAAVIGAMQAIAQLDLPLHVVGLAPACENMPSGHAYRPSDVLKAMNGKTIEIISTDAEGRLILADALCYAARYNPVAVVDLATLTGSCTIALGTEVAAGIFSNDDDLSARLREAGAKAGERLWPFPLYEEYKERLKSEVADIKNGATRQSGFGTSAAFLREFVSYPWAHLDIAPVGLAELGGPYIPKGGTGFGVRMLVEFLRGRIAG